jgi:hypothetical protein
MDYFVCFFIRSRLLWNWYQDVFALLVPSCCDKSGTSCYHLVTRLMTVTDLLQVLQTRLIQAVRNKLLRACCHQLVNNLLRADDIRLVGTTCCESQQLGTSSANTSCWQAVKFLYACTLITVQGTTVKTVKCTYIILRPRLHETGTKSNRNKNWIVKIFNLFPLSGDFLF